MHNPSLIRLSQELNDYVKVAFKECGYGDISTQVVRSLPPQTSHFQCNDSFSVAKKMHQSPFIVAQEVAKRLKTNPLFASVEAAEPGFINLLITDEYLAAHTTTLWNAEQKEGTDIPKETIILDYGGANIAKPLHVGHLRTAIIGQSLKKIARSLGHKVISDIHLGDWGLQMGMIISELKRRNPELPYFDINFQGPYPKESPVSVADLDLLYPEASKHAKEDESVMEEARMATVELQRGRPGYRALWKHFVEVSIDVLRKDYGELSVDFDLWLGESDVNDLVAPLTEVLLKKGIARKSDGATIIDVPLPGDPKEIPPLLIYNGDGAVLYGGTDLATIKERIETYHPTRIIYVVDKRQSLHMEQVFRAAKRSGFVDDVSLLEHVGFGTMNGTDNKPFKTRAGGTMKLNELVSMLIEESETRLNETEKDRDFSNEERTTIARLVGVATLKFADLSNYHEKDYIFDLKRFSAGEGYTGPYLLYSAIRAKSILKKAGYTKTQAGIISPPSRPAEREIHLLLDEYSKIVNVAWEKRSPSELCNYSFELATAFSSFYHECPVLSEEDPVRRASLLNLVYLVHETMVNTLDLLGIEVPDRM